MSGDDLESTPVPSPDFEETPIPPVSPDDPPAADESPQQSNDEAPDRCRWIGCGESLSYGGRGPRPKWCPKHKGGREITGSPSVSRGTRAKKDDKGWKDNLNNQLCAAGGAVGAAFYAFNKFDGQVILSGTPALAHSLVELADTDPRIRRSLESFVTGAAWTSVALAAAAIIVPIAANHGALPPQFKGGMTVTVPQPEY